jgi:cytochrome c oxidase subunit 2
LASSPYVELKTHEAPSLEFVWTLLPGGVLIFIGVPSLLVLYNSEMLVSPDITVKITGHQWYWSYDYRDFEGVEFDSYLKPCEDLFFGEPRLLETDNHIVIPINTSLRLLVSSADVLHRWAIPPLGLKADATPGRINALFHPALSTRGIFYGQCSEICGANHSFIPISLEITPFINFSLWTNSFF